MQTHAKHWTSITDYLVQQRKHSYSSKYSTDLKS